MSQVHVKYQVPHQPDMNTYSHIASNLFASSPRGFLAQQVKRHPNPKLRLFMHTYRSCANPKSPHVRRLGDTQNRPPPCWPANFASRSPAYFRGFRPERPTRRTGGIPLKIRGITGEQECCG